MSDAELIAIALRTGDGASGQSALDHARALLKKFGTLDALEKAGVAEIRSIRGIGPAKAATIKAALELGRRLSRDGSESKKDEPITSPQAVWRRMRGRLEGLTKENFWAVLLDVKGRVIKEVKVSEGTLSEALVHPREVFRDVIRESASKVIFVHNHPSGDPTPSGADVAMAERLTQAGELLGIPVLDNMVIGADSFRCVEVPERREKLAVAAEGDAEDD